MDATRTLEHVDPETGLIVLDYEVIREAGRRFDAEDGLTPADVIELLSLEPDARVEASPSLEL